MISTEKILFLGMFLILAYIVGKLIRRKKINICREAMVILFYIYILSVMYLTFSGLHRISEEISFYANLTPFAESINMIGVNIKNAVFQIGGNLIMLLPFGVFMPLLFKEFEKAYKTIGSGFLISLVIEFSQMIIGRTADIDDLIYNTIGVVIGYYLVIILLNINIFRKLKEKISSEESFF